MINSYEDFFNIVWDDVSDSIVDDTLWEAHEDSFYNVTFDLYNLYSKATVTLPDGLKYEAISPKVCARLLESFIENFKESINC